MNAMNLALLGLEIWFSKLWMTLNIQAEYFECGFPELRVKLLYIDICIREAKNGWHLTNVFGSDLEFWHQGVSTMMKWDRTGGLTQDISCRNFLQLLQFSAHQQVEAFNGTTGQVRNIRLRIWSLATIWELGKKRDAAKIWSEWRWHS